MEQFDEALKTAKDIARRNLDDPEADIGIAEIYVKYLGDFPQALHYYTSASKKYADPSRELTQKIKFIEENADYNYAPLKLYFNGKYKEILAKYPDSKIADDTLLAYAGTSGVGHENAVKLYEQFISKYPESKLLTSCYEKLAELYYGEKDYAKTIEFLYKQAKSIQVDMKKVQSAFKKANKPNRDPPPKDYVEQKKILLKIAKICENDMHDYPAAIKAYEETLKDGLLWVFWNFTEDLMYSACGSYFEIGLLYKKLGQNDSAMKTFQEAEAKFPTCAAYGIRQELVSLYAQAERWDELLTYLKQQPDDWQDKKLFLELLDAYTDCDRKPLKYYIPIATYAGEDSYASPARESLEKILKEYPDCKISKIVSGRLEKANLLNSNFETLQQVQEFEQTIAKYPGSPLLPEALLRLGTAYERFGAWDKAISIYKGIKVDYPESGAAYSLVGKTEMLEKKKQYLKIYSLEIEGHYAEGKIFKLDPMDTKLMWIAGTVGFFKFNKETGALTKYEEIPSGYWSGYDIAFDPFDKESIWFNAGGHLFKYNRKTDHAEKWQGLGNYKIITMKFDPFEQRILWVITGDGYTLENELYKCRLTENQCDKISLPESKAHSFVKDFVSDIEFDPVDKNILWVMSRSVNKFNKEKGTWQSYDFLWNVFLKSLKADPFNPHWIWAISDNVLFRFDRDKDEWEVFYAETESPTFNHFFEMDEKFIWISGNGGIIRVDKEKGTIVNLGEVTEIKSTGNIITIDEHALWLLGYEAASPAIYKIDLKGLSASPD